MQQHQQRICTTPRRKSTTSPAQSDVMPGWLLISPTASLMDSNSGSGDSSSCSPEKQEPQPPKSKAKRRQLTPPTPNWMKIDPEVLELGSGSDDDELRACLQNHLARKARKMETNNVEKTDYYMRATATLETPDKIQKKMPFRRLRGAVEVADSTNAEGAEISNDSDQGHVTVNVNSNTIVNHAAPSAMTGNGNGKESESHSRTQTRGHSMKLAVKVNFMVKSQN